LLKGDRILGLPGGRFFCKVWTLVPKEQAYERRT
jgi:hypothetical protein